MHRMAYDIVAFVHMWPRLEHSRDLSTGEAEQYVELPFGEEGALNRSAETIPDDLPVFLGAVLERHERAAVASSELRFKPGADELVARPVVEANAQVPQWSTSAAGGLCRDCLEQPLGTPHVYQPVISGLDHLDGQCPHVGALVSGYFKKP